MHAVNQVLVAVPLPRHGELGAADLATSYTGIDIPVLPIEGVRTHSSATSTAAVAVFLRFTQARRGAAGAATTWLCTSEPGCTGAALL